MRHLILALALIGLSTVAACSGSGENRPIGGSGPVALDDGNKQEGPTPAEQAAARQEEVAKVAVLRAEEDEARALGDEMEAALIRMRSLQDIRDAQDAEARALIARIRADRAARQSQIDAQAAEEEAARLREAEAEAARIEAQRAEEARLEAELKAQREREAELAAERAEREQAIRDQAERERIEREQAAIAAKAEEDRLAAVAAAAAAADAAEKERLQAVADEEAQAKEKRRVAVLKAQCEHLLIKNVETCDSVGVDIRDRLAAVEDAANNNGGELPAVEEPTSPPNSEHDHYEFAKMLGQLVPYVQCEAEFIKESKFRIILGHVHGEMLITCSKGIHGEEFTTIASIVGAEIGIGWKTHIEEGIMRIHGLGIGPHNFLGASVQLKAALSSGDYQTYGQGGMVSLGVAGSMFQYVGFVHATATVEGYGGALTLEIALWAPKCGSEQGLAAERGYNWDAVAAKARAEGRSDNAGCEPDPRDKPIHDFSGGPDGR